MDRMETVTTGEMKAPVAGINPPVGMRVAPPVLTKESRKMQENFQIFGVTTFLYAFFYAFCMYKNNAGVTYPLFVIASLLYIRYCMKQLEVLRKKGTIFYEISMVLLGISTFCTADSRIIAMNKLGVFLLTMAMILFNTYETKKWGLTKYLAAMLQSIVMAIGEMARPFSDAASYCKRKMGQRSKKVLYVVLSVAVSIPVVCIIFALLISADAVFHKMSIGLLENINLSNIVGVIFKAVIMFFIAYGILSYLCKKSIKEEVADKVKKESLLAIPMVGMLSVLYLVFSVIQIAGLFLGKLELPEGYSYAAYAREGFFQLLIVSILNLVIVLAGMHFFRKSKVLDVLLTFMSLCTFIMIASSAMRMILYIRMYNLTFSRIFVLWVLFVLTLLFIGVIVNLYKKQFPLFGYCIVVITLCYLVLSFSHPDYLIAKYNMEKAKDAITVDYQYLYSLNEDAAPVLKKYLTEEQAENIWYGYQKKSIRKFNVSRYIAGRLF